MSQLAETMEIKTENTDSLKRQINIFVKLVHNFKERVTRYIDDNYVEFLPNSTSNDMYLEDAENLKQSSKELLRSLDTPTLDSGLKKTLDILHQTNLELEVICRILKCDDTFQCMEEASSTKDYLVSLDLLAKLRELMFSFDLSDIQRQFHAHEAFDTIRVKYVIQCQALNKNLKEKFERLVEFNEKHLPNAVSITIQISKDVAQLQDTVIALFQTNYNVTKMCDFLLKKCLIPIITKPITILYSEEENTEYDRLQFSYPSSKTKNYQNYKDVLENIKTLLNSLCNLNVLVSDKNHVLTIIGDRIKYRFLNLLIDQCLKNNVPETLDDLAASTLVTDVLNFENMLADMFLINGETDNALSIFTKNFESYAKNRIVRLIMENANELMHKDLQDLSLVAEKNTEDDVKNNPRLVPKCMVSKSVLEFIKLLNRILRQETENATEAERYIALTSILINTYITQVPQIHKKVLEFSPQHAVVFYNNCIFLQLWVAQNFEKGIPNVTNLVKNLLDLGNRYLNQQIAQQLTALKNILKIKNSNSSGVGGGVASGAAEANETSNSFFSISLVRKCVAHLKLLQTFWQHVLPTNIYNKVMGELVDACCGELNRNILSMDTVNPINVANIVETLTLFKTQTAVLFKRSFELLNFSNWQRMTELIMLLKSSLPEITETWNDGKLSGHFKADEIVHIIRLLNPSTERRALAIAKIV